MCMKEGSYARSSSRGSSPVSVTSNSSDDSGQQQQQQQRGGRSTSTRENHPGGRARRELHPQQDTACRTTLRQSSSLQQASLQITAGTLASAVVVSFSLYFPFLLAPSAAIKTYVFAKWEYDAEISHFDNSAWTYGTDYFLALCMAALIYAIPCVTQSSFHQAGNLTRGLLASYMISVIAGGLAHQFYTTVESQNTSSFRLLWTVCVGAVAAASGFMGATATALLCLDRRGVNVVVFPGTHQRRGTLPIIPEWFWSAYALSVMAIVVAGGFSFQRPACDIFVVGITQFPSTVYMMLILWAGLHKFDVSICMRVLGCCGFIFNAPLLPMYPILVQYTDLSLGAINTLLHTWLLVAWSLQGLALRHAGNAVMQTERQLADIKKGFDSRIAIPVPSPALSQSRLDGEIRAVR